MDGLWNGTLFLDNAHPLPRRHMGAEGPPDAGLPEEGVAPADAGAEAVGILLDPGLVFEDGAVRLVAEPHQVDQFRVSRRNAGHLGHAVDVEGPVPDTMRTRVKPDEPLQAGVAEHLREDFGPG